MRAFFVAIVVVAIGYLGWVFFHGSRDSTLPALPKLEATSIPADGPATVRRSEVAPVISASRQPASAASSMSRPGVFYAVERVSRQTETGVKALHPGEEVRLMYRYKDGSMLVTNGHDEFVVKPATVTKDRELALRLAPR